MSNLTSHSQPGASVGRTLVVVQTAFLGDLLLGVSFYQKLRHQWPEHHFVLVCRKGLGDFFLKTRLFDQVYEVKKGDSQSYQKARRELDALNIEFLFCPHESLRSAFFCAGIRAKHKVAFKKWWNGFFFNERVEKPKSWPEPLRQLSLLFPYDQDLRKMATEFAAKNQFYAKDKTGKLSDIPEWSRLNIRHELKTDDFTWQRLVENLNLKFHRGEKWIFLFPGSVWATKMWSEEGFAEVGRQLQSKGYQIFVMGGPGEEKLGEDLCRKIPGSVNLVGKTSIYESAVLLARGSLVVGNDSASAHMACCADIPTVTVFGPTVTRFGYRPWSSHSYVVEIENLHCRPCGPHGHRRCPIGTHECMKALSAAVVLRSCEYAIQ